METTDKITSYFIWDGQEMIETGVEMRCGEISSNEFKDTDYISQYDILGYDLVQGIEPEG